MSSLGARTEGSPKGLAVGECHHRTLLTQVGPTVGCAWMGSAWMGPGGGLPLIGFHRDGQNQSQLLRAELGTEAGVQQGKCRA